MDVLFLSICSFHSLHDPPALAELHLTLQVFSSRNISSIFDRSTSKHGQMFQYLLNELKIIEFHIYIYVCVATIC